MRFMLYSDACIHLMRSRGRDAPRRLRQYSTGDVGISSITFAELAFHVSRSRDPAAYQLALNEFTAALDIALFDRPAAASYGLLRATLARQGKPIGPLAMLVGAHALSLDATLVTRNLGEFKRIEGLRVADWIAE